MNVMTASDQTAAASSSISRDAFKHDASSGKGADYR
jgi:hypothetical protein